MTVQTDELRKEAAARSAKLGKGATRVSAMLDGAADEIGRLRAALEQIADPLILQVGSAVGMERAMKIIATMQSIAKEALSNIQ